MYCFILTRAWIYCETMDPLKDRKRSLFLKLLSMNTTAVSLPLAEVIKRCRKIEQIGERNFKMGRQRRFDDGAFEVSIGFWADDD